MQQVNKKRLVRNFFSLSLAQGINALLQLLIVPFVITKIGMENFGVVAVAQVVMFYLATLADFGFYQTGTRVVSQNRADRQKLSSLFFNSLYTKALLCAAGFMLLLVIAAIFPVVRNHFSLYCLAFVFVPGQAVLPSWFLQGMEKMQWVAASTLFSKLLYVLLVFVFIKGPQHTPLLIFFLGLANFLTGIISSVLVVRFFRLSFTPASSLQAMLTLKNGWPFTVSNLSMNIIQYGNLFILRLFTNDLVAGYFSVAERIFFAMKQVLAAFSQTIYPNVCLLAQKGSLRLKPFFRKIFNPFFVLTILASALVFLLAPYILQFFIHEQHSESIFLLRIFCLVVPVICLNIPGTLTLLAFEKKKIYFSIYTGAALLCTLANIVLAFYWGETGTITAIFITEIFITVAVSVVLFDIFKQQVVNPADKQ